MSAAAPCPPTGGWGTTWISRRPTSSSICMPTVPVSTLSSPTTRRERRERADRGIRPMPDFDVIGLGVSTLDILTLVDHFPSGEEVQRAADLVIQGGGPVATAVVALARLGARTA